MVVLVLVVLPCCSLFIIIYFSFLLLSAGLACKPTDLTYGTICFNCFLALRVFFSSVFLFYVLPGVRYFFGIFDGGAL